MMLGRVFQAGGALLTALEPERAHELSLRALEGGVHPRGPRTERPGLAQTLWGQAFPNPVGVAAGYDKDARVPGALLAMGFGFAEVGTVTPRPQEGNARPRVFRLRSAGALINRLGFNNGGHAAALRRLEILRAADRRSGSGKPVIGVNIGANKDAVDRVADYVAGLDIFYDAASYFTINVSSPNTPGLRDLQGPKELRMLLERLFERRRMLADVHAVTVPAIVKLAPDIADEDLPEIVSVLLDQGVDGICVSNTTLRRPRDPAAGTGGVVQETGGLSGAPLFPLATRMLGRVYELTGGTIPLIGVGGVDSGAAALAKMEAGASLVQLYTGLVYRGPNLLGEIKDTLAGAVECDGLVSVADLIGRKAHEWADAGLHGLTD